MSYATYEAKKYNGNKSCSKARKNKNLKKAKAKAERLANKQICIQYNKGNIERALGITTNRKQGWFD